MGHMTIVSILNDGFDTIENHPDEFIKNIKAGMHGGFAIGNEKAVNSYPVGNYANPMAVCRSFHADTPQVFFAGRNSLTLLTDSFCNGPKDIQYLLDRIDESKKLLSYFESELKEKLKKE